MDQTMKSLLAKLEGHPEATPFTSMEEMLRELTGTPNLLPRQQAALAKRYTSEKETALNEAVLFALSMIWLDRATRCDQDCVLFFEKAWNKHSNARRFLEVVESQLTDHVERDQFMLCSAAMFLTLKEQFPGNTVTEAIAKLRKM